MKTESIVMLVFAVLLFAAIAVRFFCVKTNKRENFSKMLLFASSVLFGAALIFVFSYHFVLEVKSYLQPLYFYPSVSALIALVAAFSFFIFAKKEKGLADFSKKILIAVGVADAVILMVFFSLYYVKNIAPEEYYSKVNSLWLAVGAVGLSAVLFVLSLLFGEKTNKSMEIKSITYGAISIAMSFALSYIQLFKLPQGGSVTLVSLLPLLLYSQMFGVRKGVMMGLIYGLLQAIQDPWILHPAQFLLDYPIAFASVGLSALFTRSGIKGVKGIVLFALGAICAVLFRYSAHVISGIFAFSMYAAEGYGAVAWGFLYNSFAFVDMAIALAVGVIMLSNGAFRATVNKIARSAFSAPFSSQPIPEPVLSGTSDSAESARFHTGSILRLQPLRQK